MKAGAGDHHHHHADDDHHHHEDDEDDDEDDHHHEDDDEDENDDGDIICVGSKKSRDTLFMTCFSHVKNPQYNYQCIIVLFLTTDC